MTELELRVQQIKHSIWDAEVELNKEMYAELVDRLETALIVSKALLKQQRIEREQSKPR